MCTVSIYSSLQLFKIFVFDIQCNKRTKREPSQFGSREHIASVQQIQQMHNAQAQHLENSVKLVIYNYNQQL